MFTDQAPINTPVKEVSLVRDGQTVEKVSSGKTSIAFNPEALGLTQLIASGNQMLIVSCADELLRKGVVDVLSKQQQQGHDWREDTRFSGAEAIYVASVNQQEPMTILLVEEDGSINQTNFEGGVLTHSAQLSRPEYSISSGQRVSSGVFSTKVDGSYATSGGSTDNRPYVFYGPDTGDLIDTSLKRWLLLRIENLFRAISHQMFVK